jgi:hypothetical protein
MIWRVVDVKYTPRTYEISARDIDEMFKRDKDET